MNDNSHNKAETRKSRLEYSFQENETRNERKAKTME